MNAPYKGGLMKQPTIRAATDVGGTFTDPVYFRTNPKTRKQEIVTAKTDTTPF
jgi:N-methylhydantoinase A